MKQQNRIRNQQDSKLVMQIYFRRVHRDYGLWKYLVLLEKQINQVQDN